MVIARKKRSERLYILNGVRRAVAVREAGKKTIQATIHRAGKSPVSRRIALDRLFSPKARVELDARFYRPAAVDRAATLGLAKITLRRRTSPNKERMEKR